MLFIFSTLDEIRHLWQLKRVIFLHRYQIRAFPLSRTYFTFSLIVETTTKSHCNLQCQLSQFATKTLVSLSKNTQHKNKKNLQTVIIFVYLFRAASYRLMSILYKDVLLHYFLGTIGGAACPPIILVKWVGFLYFMGFQGIK